MEWYDFLTWTLILMFGYMLHSVLTRIGNSLEQIESRVKDLQINIVDEKSKSKGRSKKENKEK